MQQLLQAPLGYKAKCEFDAKNGEKKRQKYENIFDILMQKYPDEKEKYSNKKKMNKKRVAAKLKSMRYGFKKAIDCGKKNGGGHDVCTILIFSIPALTSIQNSINSSKQLSNDNSDSIWPVGSSSILDIADVKDLSNEKESNELSNKQEISKCQDENDADAGNSECDPTQPNARPRKVEEMLNEKKGEK